MPLTSTLGNVMLFRHGKLCMAHFCLSVKKSLFFSAHQWMDTRKSFNILPCNFDWICCGSDYNTCNVHIYYFFSVASWTTPRNSHSESFWMTRQFQWAQLELHSRNNFNLIRWKIQYKTNFQTKQIEFCYCVDFVL